MAQVSISKERQVQQHLFGTFLDAFLADYLGSDVGEKVYVCGDVWRFLDPDRKQVAWKDIRFIVITKHIVPQAKTSCCYHRQCCAVAGMRRRVLRPTTSRIEHGVSGKRIGSAWYVERRWDWSAHFLCYFDLLILALVLRTNLPLLGFDQL